MEGGQPCLFFKKRVCMPEGQVGRGCHEQGLHLCMRNAMHSTPLNRFPLCACNPLHSSKYTLAGIKWVRLIDLLLRLHVRLFPRFGYSHSPPTTARHSCLSLSMLYAPARYPSPGGHKTQLRNPPNVPVPALPGPSPLFRGGSSRRQVFCWVDVLAINQHPGRQQARDLQDLEVGERGGEKTQGGAPGRHQTGQGFRGVRLEGS
jgi:hypothetical protein